MSSENASDDTVQKIIEVQFSLGCIVLDGVEDFSIDITNPKLNVGKLYKALFKNISEPTTITLERADSITPNSREADVFTSLKTIVDDACETINNELPNPPIEAEDNNQAPDTIYNS